MCTRCFSYLRLYCLYRSIVSAATDKDSNCCRLISRANVEGELSAMHAGMLDGEIIAGSIGKQIQIFLPGFAKGQRS